MNSYNDFLESKRQKAISSGFEKPKSEMNKNLFEWQKDIDFWALKKGRERQARNAGNR